MKPDRDQLLAYALGHLPPDEEARVEAALDADPALRAELRADLEALTLLADDLDLSRVEVPRGAGEQLLARVRAEQQEVAPTPAPVPVAPPRPVLRRRAWRLPAALALAAALALVFFLLPRPGADPATRYARMPGAVQQAIEVNGNTLGTLVRLPDGRVYVRLSRPAQAGRTYQLWRIEAGTPVSLGVFGQDLLVSLPPSSTLAVSVEPPGGSSQPTTQPLFVQKV